MAVSARQAELFAGESWQSLYRAFAQINFNASDPVSLNRALRDYIQINYPEDFNDWIVSSEFVALIDLLSWLSGALAFKTDIAARENFIDTAEARESILRLARFLSYNPSRCQPATGILKLVEVSTDDDVFDSFGINQANNTITWNDSNNANWFEQFTAILNNSFVSTNPFGIPLKTGVVANVQTQLYRVNGLASDSSMAFTATSSGTAMDFEVCNGDFTDRGMLFERAPNPNNAFHLYYLNDSNGNSSSRTGFFLLFKQGSTQQQTVNITVPIENQLIDVNSTNVNQNDVWVQTVIDNGSVTTDWTKVPAMVTTNITFNDIPTSDRNIFSVLTRDNDQITLRFSDGRFGNAPSGNIKVTYRVSNGLSYQIKPLEIDNITLPISFINRLGSERTLNLTFSLYENVANAATAETIEQIRQRAPQVYATQNRMVSGEDYNVFPLSSNLAAKIKAVNRVYSGQSRYIDLHDPTGTYQDLSLFAEDGILFRDQSDTYVEVPISLNSSTSEIINDYVRPVLDQQAMITLIRDVFMQNVLAGQIVAQSNRWTTSSANLFKTTGWFSGPDSLIQPGAIIQFAIAGTPTWIAVVDVAGPVNTIPPQNTAGPVTLAQEVPSGSIVMTILPSASVTPSAAVLAEITEKIDHNLSFSLWYDYWNAGSTGGPVWTVQAPQNDFGSPMPTLVGSKLLILTMNYISRMWRMNSRGLRLVFESINDIQWFDNGNRALAQPTGEAGRDTIRIMRINRDVNNRAGYAMPVDYNLAIDRLWLYADGSAEPRRSTVLLYDIDQDGYPDQPDAYYKLTSFGYAYQLTADAIWTTDLLTVATTAGITVGQTVTGVGIPPGTSIKALTATTITLSKLLTADLPSGQIITVNDALQQDTYLFWSNADNPPYDQPLFTVKAYAHESLRETDTPEMGTVGFQIAAKSYLDEQTFWVQTAAGWKQDVHGTYRVEHGRGPNVAASLVTEDGTLIPRGDSIIFHWKHYASSDHRIDPSPTNIHDIFVLTFEYDTQVRRWINSGAILTELPAPPTELDLRLQFSNRHESVKMFSDQIVWRPVRYKFLFGRGADATLQGQFKVVRLANAAISDGEIRSRIIMAINVFFNVSNWDFGETFFYTELAAYIHQQLAGLIGSVVLVPLNSEAAFGDGFEVTCRSDEIFISTAQVSDIVLITSNTAVNLRIRT